MKTPIDPYLKEYSKLKGKTVRLVIRDSAPAELGGTCYGLEFTDGTLAWIMMDPEGNGPGFLEIVEPEKSK